MKQKLKQLRKPSVTLPVGGSSPLTVTPKRGRPKGSKNKSGKEKDPQEKGLLKSEAPGRTLKPKASTVLKNMVADVEALHQLPALVAAEHDGGGTHETSPTITKESLERRISRRLNVLDRYLTDDMLHTLLTQSSLKEIGIYEGIMMDKSLVLKGQPTVIIGNADRAGIDSVLPRLLQELKRRGLTATATERTIEFKGTDS